MDLFKDYKYLADKINTKRKNFVDKELGDKYNGFMDSSLKNVEMKLAKLGIDIRTKSGNLTKSREAFESMPKRIQKAIIKQLKSMHTNKIFGTVKKFNTNRKLVIARNIATFKGVLGDERWGKMCDYAGSEEEASELITDRIGEIRNREGKQYTSDQLIVESVVSYLPDDVEIQQAESELEVQRMEMERLAKPRDWGKSFFSNK